MTSALARAGIVLCAVLAVACIDTTSPSFVNQGQSNGVGGGSGGGGGSGSLDSALVGTWIGPTQVDTVNGHPQTVDTTFTFNANGSTIVQVATVDLVTNVNETLVSTGTWTASGSSLTVELTSPTRQNLSYSYTVTGSLLKLNQDSYVRTG